ncbi:MAG: glycosyltransferase [Flavobacteriia bacterium]|nr:glycosyltransferase [Flavobacteriia bacterium]
MNNIKLDISILIINYKTPELLYKCVESVYKYTSDITFEIIIIDNHSEDNSKELITNSFQFVTWEDMGCNSGFGCANNRAIEKAKGEYLLLLNSDTELYENSIKNTLEYYKKLQEKYDVGFVGCRIEGKDFSLQPSCNYYYSGLIDVLQENAIVILVWKRLLKKKILKDVDQYKKLQINHEVSWLGVPFAIIDSNICKKQNIRFDEDFFMYAEDKELNFRLSKNGYRHFYFAETGVFHLNGGSNEFEQKRLRQIFVSKLLFILKAYGSIYFIIYVFIFYINLFFDELFFIFSKIRNKYSILDINNKKMRSFYFMLLNKYSSQILRTYSKKNNKKKSLNTYNDAL